MQAALADAELLIADGHHRYETARTYAEEIGGEGEHRYVLMCLVSMSDPGPDDLSDPPAGRQLEDDRPRAARAGAPARLRASTRSTGGSRPRRGNGDARLRLRGRERRARCGSSWVRPSRRTGHWRTTRRDLSPPRHRRAREARARGRARHDRGRHLAPARARVRARPGGGRRALRSGEYDIAFLLRPTPVEQVQAVAEAGETMPPKSTYFYPKLLIGPALQPALDQGSPGRTSRAGARRPRSRRDLHVALEHRLRGMDLPGGDAGERSGPTSGT